MELIRRVEIEGFRSLQKQALEKLGSLSALVGKNSCGKSNVLRALNLFFNNEVEPGKPLGFARDHYEQLPRIKRKKRISIAVDFALPSYFKLRHELTPLETLGSNFRVRKTWQLDKRLEPVLSTSVEVDGELVPNGSDLAEQFLPLVFFRYVPNRTVPSDVLRDESQAIAKAIFGRMKGDQHSAELLKGLSAAAARLLSDAAESMRSSESPLVSPSVSTADSIGEMLTMSGFQATGTHGLEVQDEDWGTGHQAFFLYEVLRTLDAGNYGQFFGWRQATVWGVEEPESALHRDLEARLAGRLREWCHEDRWRLQVLQTTHSPTFAMAADSGYWLELRDRETEVIPMEIPRLTRAAERRGVSVWSPPALAFPWNPVVLVEGAIDSKALEHVAGLASSSQLRFVALPQFDADEPRGGKDSAIRCVRRNQTLLQNRPKDAPLVLLLDWEASDQELERARKAYGAGAKRYVLRMDSSHCFEEMGPDFRGVERFYPPRIAREAHAAGEIVLGAAQGKPLSVSKAQLEGAKGQLLKRLLAVDDLSELSPLVKVLADVEAAVRRATVLQISLPGLEETRHDLPAPSTEQKVSASSTRQPADN